MIRYTKGQLELAKFIYNDIINSDEVGFIDQVNNIIANNEFILRPDIISVLNITGRGLVFVVDDDEIYNIGDKIQYEMKIYEIRFIEGFMKGNRMSSNKGLVVKLFEE